MRLPHMDPVRVVEYAEFAEKLDELAEQVPQDEAWLPWPSQDGLSPGTLNVYRWRINVGDLLGDDYQAAVRRGRLYVRKLK